MRVTRAMSSYLYDGTHVLITGITGSGERYGGKTATGNWWLSEAVEQGHYQYAIAFYPGRAGGKFDGETVHGAREAADAIADGARYLEWVPDPGDVENAHNDAVKFAEGLDGSVIMAHDDAIRYAQSDSLAWATAAAGNPSGGGAVKSLVISQDPWDLPRKGVRANLPVMVWVGPMTDTGRRFFEQTRSSQVAETIDARHVEPFMWSVIDGDTIDTYTPVPERYA